VKNAKIGAIKDKITEKRHSPMVVFHKTFNYSILHTPTDYNDKKGM
jgi:hypothetical protein